MLIVHTRLKNANYASEAVSHEGRAPTFICHPGVHTHAGMVRNPVFWGPGEVETVQTLLL